MASLPLAAADWGGRGFYEPDTAYDRGQVAGVGTWMYPEPTLDETEKAVYFSAYSGFFVATFNPNSGVVGSHVQAYPSSSFAMLGVWTDCNDDKFIGTLDSALMEYRIELLDAAGRARCTADGLHNDGEWIREFRWIGPDFITFDGDVQNASAENDTNAWNLADEEARIWGDFGRPDDAASTRSCPVNPRPRGTYQSTGGFLRYVDCHLNWQLTGGVNFVAQTTGQHHLRFNDSAKERPDQSNSTLNVRNPWGQYGDGSYVTVWSCTSNPHEVRDPTGQVEDPVIVKNPTNESRELVNQSFQDDDGRYFHVYPPAAPSPNAGGSGYGTTDHLSEGLEDCDPDDGEAEPDTADGDLYDIDEDDFEGSSGARKETDFYFYFYEGQTNGGVITTVDHGVEGQDPAEVESPLGEHYDDLGVGLLPWYTGDDDFQPFWYGVPGYVASRNPYVNRDTLQPWGAVWITFRAYVDPVTHNLDVPSAQDGRYGDPWCSATNAPQGGNEAGGEPVFFECDPAKWWIGPDGQGGQRDISDAMQVRAGQAFNLMDVDCYDASPFKGSPVNTGPLSGPHGAKCQR